MTPQLRALALALATIVGGCTAADSAGGIAEPIGSGNAQAAQMSAATTAANAANGIAADPEVLVPGHYGPDHDSRYSRLIRQARIDHAGHLVARGDVRSLLGAALLTNHIDGHDNGPSARALDYLRQAQQRDPDQVLVWVVTRALCGTDHAGACDTDAAHAQLTRLEPGNAAFWVDRFAQDPQRHRDALLSAYAADHYDDYHVALTILALTTHQGLQFDEASLPDLVDSYAFMLGGIEDPAPDPATLLRALHVMEAMLSVTGFAYASYSPLLETCDDPDADATIRDGCIRLYRQLLADSTHLYGHSVAHAGLKRHVGDSETDRQAVRRTQWASAFMAMYSETQPQTDLLRFMERSMTIGELPAVHELMTRQGVALEPPDNWDYEAWLDSAAHSRSSTDTSPE